LLVANEGGRDAQPQVEVQSLARSRGRTPFPVRRAVAVLERPGSILAPAVSAQAGPESLIS